MEQQINVKSLRESLKLSQTELAGIIGVCQGTVSLWETRGAPKRGAAKKALLNLALYGPLLVKNGAQN
ncbi:helix-turn-helix domain-containing protein [Brucella gallinifaecis]|uniref:helix-turn-helix domain-containing protein n=1 Tax=Brucella gallinifaecis TaxID=215590 RepID=UPI00387EC34F